MNLNKFQLKKVDFFNENYNFLFNSNLKINFLNLNKENNFKFSSNSVSEIIFNQILKSKEIFNFINLNEILIEYKKLH